ncbi:MAG: transposase [Chitinophagales bacterium]|nr:transposase [Bacteroidota bacterium]MBK8487757.1 transposase [Bacteroidota bacterium]MBK8682488.1 transposase [Bacteroidota bacterium]MBP8754707.1 transposase [Chitinophagales bacterium]MBP9548547.1 transposase [Chitinophagales bacterium]
MSWVRIWVHLVFTTKKREQFLHTKELRKKVFQHIKSNANKQNIWLDCVNGYSEHAHCLISLNKNKSISDITQLIKGESSHWINGINLIEENFMWQDDYWAVSVSESHLQRTREYIYKQEEHHSKTAFKTELDAFVKKYGWQHITP